MKKIVALMLALLLCAGLLAGCVKEPAEEPDPTPSTPTDPTPTDPQPVDPTPVEPDPTPAEPKILKLLRTAEEAVLTPHDANASNNSVLLDYMISLLYSNRPTPDGTKSQIQPDFAAAEPTVAADGVTWTIKLREDVKWPDGQKITADDWIYSWQKSMDPKLMYSTGATAASGNNATIKGASAYYKQVSDGVTLSWDTVGIKKVSDYEITVEVTKQVTAMDLMRHFASRSLGLVRKDIYEQCISADGSTCDYGSSMDKLMVCGAYLLKSWEKGSVAELTKNPDYPHADQVYMDGVYTRVVTDEATRLELFETGEADYVALGTNGLAKYGEDPRVMTYTTKNIETLEVNQNNPDKPYLADAGFRKALFYAMDRNAIAKLTNMISAPYFISTVGQVLDDGTTYRDYVPVRALEQQYAPNGGYDPDLANKYLEEAFKKFNLTSVTLTITYNEDDLRRAASEYIQSSFQKIFGDKVKIELAAYPKTGMSALMRSNIKAPTNEWDLCWSTWGFGAETYAPWTKAKGYSSSYSNPYALYTNTRLNDLCILAATDEYRLDDEKLADLTVEMEKAMYEDMTCLPVVQKQTYAIFSERYSPARVFLATASWDVLWGSIK